MKKIFLFVLALVSVLVLFSFTGCEQESSVDDFTIHAANDKMWITGYTGTASKVVIPSEIKGFQVEAIVSIAFSGNETIKTLVIPDGVTEIQGEAFVNCKNLKKVIMSDNSVRHIMPGAFKGCTNLEEVILPKSLKSISELAFENCTSLKKIHIPNKEVELGFSFYNSGLEKVTFEEGILEIGRGAFSHTKIKKFVCPDNVEKIGLDAFRGCTELETVKLNEGLKSIVSTAFVDSKIKEIIIPASVTDITEASLAGCDDLQAVKFQGDAPESFDDPDYDKGNYTVYYHENAKGFTGGTWCGYPTKIW